MKKLLVVVLASSFSLVAFAQGNQPNHIISIGTDGLGWSGLSNKFNRDKEKTSIKDQDSSTGKLALNYNYVFSSRVMVGAELGYEMDKSETNYESGNKYSSELSTTSLALSVGYNFNEDLFNSWWIKGSLGGGSIKSETEDTTETPEKDESDIGISFFTIEAGKRFSFDSWGLKNFSYAPSIAITSATYSGDDADDAGFESSTSVQINVLKFDILF